MGRNAENAPKNGQLLATQAEAWAKGSPKVAGIVAGLAIGSQAFGSHPVVDFVRRIGCYSDEQLADFSRGVREGIYLTGTRSKAVNTVRDRCQNYDRIWADLEFLSLTPASE